jgi:peptide-methionine (R)-S-oxide reductase
MKKELTVVVDAVNLFESNSKFDAHCGWPFIDAMNVKKNVLDKTHGMIRTEIVCANCGGHLGHVFNDKTGGNLVV